MTNDQANKARIFLSYSPRDMSELCQRLRADLILRGYSVWQDTRNIREAWQWDEEIEAGINQAQVLLFLISPCAVRRAGAPGNPDNQDSVCLDEIAYARYEAGIPIIPVRVGEGSAPLLIYRLQTLDLTRWQVSDALYAIGLEQICRTIDAAQHGQVRERIWKGLPSPWDFAPFLLEHRGAFTGREWLFEAIASWRANDASNLLIVGDPGIGKSAIVGELVRSNIDGQVLAYHCCQWDTPETLKPGRFIQSLAAMIATRLPAYAALLEQEEFQVMLSESYVLDDPASAFEASILAPLAKINPEDGAMYLLIDALDEALLYKPGPTIVDVLATRLGRFPSWLRIVATARADRAVSTRLAGLHAELLNAQDPRNQDDVLRFIKARLASAKLAALISDSGRSAASIEEAMFRASEGNFLVATQIFNAIDNKQLSLEQIGQFPVGLESQYQHFFRRLYPDPENDFTQAKRVLQIIIAAKEHLSRLQIADVTGFDSEEVLPQILKRLAHFIPVREKRYIIFHRSLFDWLSEWDEANDQSRAGEFYVSLKRGHEQLANWCWLQYQQTPQKLPDYVLRYLSGHLAQAQHWDKLAQLLLDWRYLEAKVECTNVSSVFDLITDIKQALSLMPAQQPYKRSIALLMQALRFDANFIARHPATLFQCCWNRAWWHDAADCEFFFSPPEEGWPQVGSPWARPGQKLSSFMEDWRYEKAIQQPGFQWLRALRPLPDTLGSVQVAIMPGHSKGNVAINLSTDEQKLVSGSEDGSICLWNLAHGGSLVVKIELGENNYVNDIAFNPSGDSIVAGLGDGSLGFYDPDTLTQINTLQPSDKAITALVFSPDGKWLVTGDSDGVIRLWDPMAAEQKACRKAHHGQISAIAYGNNGSEFATGESANLALRLDRNKNELKCSIRRWECSDKLVELSALAVNGDVEALCYSADDQTLIGISREFSGRILFMDIPDNHLTDINVYWPTALAIHPDGAHVLVGAGAGDASIFHIEIMSKKVVAHFPVQAFCVTGLHVYHQGQDLISADLDGIVRLWQLGLPEFIEDRLCNEPEVRHLIFAPDGEKYFTADGVNSRVIGRRVETGRPLFVFNNDADRVQRIALSPAGRLLAVATSDGLITVCDVDERKELVEFKEPASEVTAMTFSDDEKYLVAATNDGTLCLWNIEAQTKIVHFQDLCSEPIAIACSTDIQYLMTVCSREVQVWDVAHNKLYVTFEGTWTHDSKAFFSADNETAIVVDGEHDQQQLSVWQINTGCLLETSNEHLELVKQPEMQFLWQGANLDETNAKDQKVHSRVDQTLSSRETGQVVAYLPLEPMDVIPHPSGRIWAMNWGITPYIFKLEQEDCKGED